MKTLYVTALLVAVKKRNFFFVWNGLLHLMVIMAQWPFCFNLAGDFSSMEFSPSQRGKTYILYIVGNISLNSISIE